jgi:hypothetical protein
LPSAFGAQQAWVRVPPSRPSQARSVRLAQIDAEPCGERGATNIVGESSNAKNLGSEPSQCWFESSLPNQERPVRFWLADRGLVRRDAVRFRDGALVSQMIKMSARAVSWAWRRVTLRQVLLSPLPGRRPETGLPPLDLHVASAAAGTCGLDAGLLHSVNRKLAHRPTAGHPALNRIIGVRIPVSQPIPFRCGDQR